MVLTNLQVELLKTFRYDLSEAQILEIEGMLAKYFADKATRRKAASGDIYDQLSISKPFILEND